MSKLKSIIENIIDISTDEWDYLLSLLKKETFKAKTTLINQGKTARKLYFIEQGLIRSFRIIDGKEINIHFAADGKFITAFASFITQTPSLEYVESIEDSLVYSISYRELTELYNKYPKFERLGRILSEESYLYLLERSMILQSKTAIEKYKLFINYYDDKIINKVPQYQIASFLGITPESLSRIRKQIYSS